jgi:SHS2 domain-containing protein
MASHAFEPHTGEVQLRLDAANPAELFAEAVPALAELLGTPADEAPHEWQRVAVAAPDIDGLLVAWVNELVARTEIDHLLYCEVEINDLTPTQLDACIRGVPFGETRTAVKAATMHGLHVTSGPAGSTATLILDV